MTTRSRTIVCFAMLTVGLACALAPSGTSAQTPSTSKTGAIEGFEPKFVDAGGVRTRYYDYGNGETILLVHGGFIGGASTANNWTRNIPGLAKRFRVVAVDRLAQGMTGNPADDSQFTNEGVVKHLRSFVEAMHLGPVHVVGHSSGGAIALYFASEYPELVKTLTVVAHGPGMPPLEGPTKFDAILEKCPPDPDSYEHRKCRLLALAHREDTFSDEYAAADDYMGNLPKSVETRQRMQALSTARPGWLAAQNDAYRKRVWDRARNEGNLQMPILVWVAMQDTLSWKATDPHPMLTSELAFFDIIGAKNPRVKLIAINDAGHFPYREHPEQFNADLTAFVEFWRNRT